MNKTTKYLSVMAVLFSGMFLSATSAYADLAPLPGPVSGGNIVLIGAGVGVGIVALISWLVIRAIRRKKNVINK